MTRSRQADPDRAAAPVVGLAETYAAGLVGTHAHRRAQLAYAVSGAIRIAAGGGVWVLPPSRALWISPGLQHSVAMRGRVELRTLYARPGLRHAPRESAPRVVAVSPLLREALLRAASLPWTWRPGGPEARLIRLVFDELALMPVVPLSQRFPTDARALRVAHALAANPADPRSLPQHARDAGASARTLERLFVAETGSAFGAWRQQLRFLAALERAAAGQTITAAALAVGYANPSSFVRLFRRRLGTTPGRYLSA